MPSFGKDARRVPSQRQSPTLLRLLPLRACASAIALVVALLLPATASAGYVVEPWVGCSGSFNSGQWDEAGNLYIPCGNPTTIGVYGPDGNLLNSIPLDYYASDVAPSPGGEYLYTASGSGAPRRLNNDSSGGWSLDSAWRLATYSLYGSPRAAQGHFIATDANGSIYLADGAWSSNNTHTVIKYTAGGAFVTRFGEYANSWSAGTFYWMLTGLVASRDGATIYTTETGNNRVQVWRQQLDGSYAHDGGWGGTAANNPTREGYCDFGGWVGKFAAPYDVALDRAGAVYVINTTCKQVLKFDALGNYIVGVDVRLAGGDYPRPHGFAVAADGTVYVGENQKVLRLDGTAQPTNGGPPDRGTDISVAPAAGAPSPIGGPTSPDNAGVGPTAAAQALDTTPPRLRVRPALALSRGGRTIAVAVTCSEACSLSTRVLIRRSRMRAPGATRRVEIASGIAKASGGDAAIVTARVSQLGRRLLRGRSGVELLVITTARDRSGNISRLRKVVNVRS